MEKIYTLRPGAMGPASRWSRVMKERSWPSSPLTKAKQAVLPTFNPVGQSCRFAPIKKLSIYSVAIENAYEPNSLPETQPADGVYPWLKKPVRFQGI
jgi:hypothetical protein